MQSKQEIIRQAENGLRAEYFIKGDKLKSIIEVMKEINTPGISIAIIDNFDIVWSKGYGISDAESQLSVNTDTIFQAASISKPLTALAVMKLVQDGILDLDENINSYLKSWKLPENEFTANNKVTLRNLLSHTAGVTVQGFPGYNIDVAIPTLVQVLMGEPPANTGKVVVDMEPNTQFRYSGGGYTIVQQVLIDQLQKSFQEIMHELVLAPLGMNSSFYSNAALNEEQGRNATAGHNGDGNQIPGKRHLYPEMAAAGLWTTAEDLAKFSIEVQKSLKGESNKILTKEFMEVMTTPVLNGEYNIGLRNEKIGAEQFVGHNGGNEGYTCSTIFHKDKGFGMVFMSNSDRGYEMKMPLFRSVAIAYGWENILHPNFEVVNISIDEIKPFIGNYKMEFDKTMKIFQYNNKLVYKTIFDEMKQLDYVGKNIMIDTKRTVKFEFRKESNNLYINGNEIQRLKDGEKLASDYIEEGNIELAAQCYQELMKKDNNMKSWLENNLNNSGYNCMSKNNYNTAIAFLKINTILFPQSGNAWDSLGEVYLFDKQYELSIEAMKKSLEYNSNNQNAISCIKDAMEFLKKNIKVDLHMHTTDSDGTITIEDLLKEILDKKIKLFSITEHETMVNMQKAKTFAKDNGLLYIAGVELTVNANGRRHVLGYGVDPDNEELRKVMLHNKPLLDSGMEDHPHLFSEPKEAIEAIIAAGGIPVLAHPGAGFYDSDYKGIINQFIEYGVKGIECYHPENDANITAFCLEVCREKDLFITGGSDYHGDCVPSRKLGMLGLELSDLSLKGLLIK